MVRSYSLVQGVILYQLPWVQTLEPLFWSAAFSGAVVGVHHIPTGLLKVQLGPPVSIEPDVVNKESRWVRRALSRKVWDLSIPRT